MKQLISRARRIEPAIHHESGESRGHCLTNFISFIRWSLRREFGLKESSPPPTGGEKNQMQKAVSLLSITCCPSSKIFNQLNFDSSIEFSCNYNRPPSILSQPTQSTSVNETHSSIIKIKMYKILMNSTWRRNWEKTDS